MMVRKQTAESFMIMIGFYYWIDRVWGLEILVEPRTSNFVGRVINRWLEART